MCPLLLFQASAEDLTLVGRQAAGTRVSGRGHHGSQDLLPGPSLTPRRWHMGNGQGALAAGLQAAWDFGAVFPRPMGLQYLVLIIAYLVPLQASHVGG